MDDKTDIEKLKEFLAEEFKAYDDNDDDGVEVSSETRPILQESIPEIEKAFDFCLEFLKNTTTATIDEKQQKEVEKLDKEFRTERDEFYKHIKKFTDTSAYMSYMKIRECERLCSRRSECVFRFQANGYCIWVNLLRKINNKKIDEIKSFIYLICEFIKDNEDNLASKFSW